MTREREYLNSYSPEHFTFVRQSGLHRSDFGPPRPAWTGYLIGLALALALIGLARWLA